KDTPRTSQEANMLDHISLTVSDFAKSKSFFQRALAPLGYTKLMAFSGAAGFGMAGKPDFWISQGPAPKPVHVAFAASDRKIVDAFHKAALAAGGGDNGAPFRWAAQRGWKKSRFSSAI